MADSGPPRPPRDIRRRRHGAGVRSFAAVALAAGVLAAANALSAKGLYAHWAIRPRYGLSGNSQRILADTKGTLVLVAAFERSHPFRTPARRLLRQYDEAARTLPGLHLSVREIDLNHEPAEAAALLRRTRSTADASAANAIVVSFGGRDVVLDEYELASDSGAGGSRFDGERAVSTAILRLAHPVRKTVCFSSGHGEFDPENTHPVGGASALARALASGGYDVRRLAGTEREIPADCGILVVAGPRTMFSPQEIEAVSSWLSRGGRAVFLVDNPHAAGLAPLLRVWGIELAPAPGGARGVRPSALHYGSHDAVRDMENVLTVFTNPCTVRPVDPGRAENRADKPVAEPIVFAASSGPEEFPVAVASELHSSGAGGPGGATRLVVFGDSEFVSNGMLGAGRAGNAMLFAATANWLADSPRPPTPAASGDALDTGVAPDAWPRLALLLALGVPGAILLFGLLVWSPLSNQL